MPISIINLPSFAGIHFSVFFLALFIFLGFLLLVPVDIKAVWRWDEGSKSQIRVVWLFGLISKDLNSKDLTLEEKSETKTKEGSPKGESEDEGMDRSDGKKGEKWITGKKELSILRTEGLMRNLERLALGTARAIEVHYLKVSLKVGFEDPADTGIVFGFLWSVAAPFNVLDSADITIESSFEDEVFKGDASCSFRIWPIIALRPIFRFIFSVPTLKVARTLAIMKWQCEGRREIDP